MSVDIMVAVQGAKMSLDWLVEIYWISKYALL